MENVGAREFSQLSKREATEHQITQENVFGYSVVKYQNLNEVEKRNLWISQDGKDFIGQVGEVRRYVVGIPRKAERTILEEGFNPLKKTWKSGSLPGLRFMGSGEGDGTYATQIQHWP